MDLLSFEPATTSNSTSPQAVVQLSRGGIVALMLVAEAGMLSHITVASFFVFVIFYAVWSYRRPTANGEPRWRLIRTGMDYYFFNLLFMELVQSLGSVLHIRWINRGEVESRTAYCGAQGFAKQFGDVGVALSTLAIAVYTFMVLFLRWRVSDSAWLHLGIIALIWLFLVLIIAIPWATKTDYYFQTTYWCWINRRYKQLQLGLEYGIMWFVALSGLALYIPVFYRFQHSVRNFPQHRLKQMRIARQFVIYPIAYVILVVPISAVRLYQFNHSPPSNVSKPVVNSAWVGFAGVVFSLSGFVDTMLYLIIRPSIFRSFLALFQSNQTPRDGAPTTAGAALNQAGGPPATTMPEVTIANLSDEVTEEPAQFSSQPIMQQRYQPRLDERDYGLPTVTMMSENHLMPPSLSTRGAGPSGSRTQERPSDHQAEATSSTATDYRGLLSEQRRSPSGLTMETSATGEY